MRCVMLSHSHKIPRVLGIGHKAVFRGNVRLPSPQTGFLSSTSGFLEGFVAEVWMTIDLMEIETVTNQ